MAQLAITNFVTISVSQASPGLGEYNTSNLAIFTDEAPDLDSFGDDGFAAYLSPTEVGIDFGTDSKTYQMAVEIFSQQPNILNGDGQLIVILVVNAIKHVAFSGTPASGDFKFSYNSNLTAVINWNDSASVIQGKLRAVVGLEKVVVTGSMATTLNIQMAGIYEPLTFTTSANTLATSGPVSITITITTPTAAESLAEAIARTQDLVQYFGIISDETADVIGSVDVLAAGVLVQTLNKIIFFVGNVSADLDPDGLLDDLRSGSLTQSRGLYYGGSDLEAIEMMAAYAGRALSTNFNGSNTTSTMNLKVLAGIQPDSSLTQTLLNKAKDAGVDTYASYQGVPAIYSTGANSYFDQVYNLQWYVGALQVAVFNYLAQSTTKIPQTESGMDGLKSAARAVSEQAVTNGWLASGTWTSSTTFGNQAQFYLNISQRGYYIYSVPVSQQNVADREAREAPLMQIAAKEAGAIQSANVLIVVNS